MKKLIAVLLSFTFIFGSLAVKAADSTVPGVPGSVKAAATVGGNTKLSWSAVSGATGYVTYFSVSATGGFTRLAVTKATGLTTANKRLYYKVRAYKTVNTVNVYGVPSKAFATPEISVTGLKSKMSGATILKAWQVADNATGTTVRVEKLTYGSPVSTSYKGKSYSIPQICFIAIVHCKPENIRSTCAPLALGKDEGLTNDMAKKAGALVAVNNEGYAGHWDPHRTASFLGSGPVVKEGQVIVYRTQASGTGVYKNGTWKRNLVLTKNNVKSEIDKGLSYSQAPGGCEAVIWDGKIQLENPRPYYSQNVLFGGGENGLRNRTFYAQIDASNYLLMVGEFMQMGKMMDILLAYGAKKAFWCNGGNCSTMYLRGTGNVTGTAAPKLVNLDKLNVLEQEWLGSRNYLDGGKGEACPAIDIVYIK